MQKFIRSLFFIFIFLFPFLIYPWGAEVYYANAKAYYFIGILFIICTASIFNGRRNGRSFRKVTGIEWLLLVFLLLNALSTFFSVKMSLVGYLTEHQGFLVMTSYVASFVFVSRTSAYIEQRKIFYFMSVSAFIASLYGILQHFHRGFLLQDHMMEFGSRNFSFFDNPDYFGSYLVLMLIITMGLFLSEKECKGIALLLVILCVLYIALLESETRSAWLGTGVGLFILTVFTVRQKRYLWRRLGVMFLAFGLIFTLMNIVQKHGYVQRAVTVADDVQKIVVNQDRGSAGASRWFIWQESMPLIEEHFWLGTGPNTFREVFKPHDLPAYNNYIGNSIIYDENNEYLQIALTMGVPALLIYLMFHWMIIYRGFKKAQEGNGEAQILKYSLLAAAIGYMVQAFFNISVVSVAPYFWVILGLLANREYIKTKNDTIVS